MNKTKRASRRKSKQPSTGPILTLSTPARQIILTKHELVVTLHPSIVKRIHDATLKDLELKRAFESLYRWAFPPRIKTDLITRVRLIEGYKENKKTVEIRYKLKGFRVMYVYDLTPEQAKALRGALNQLRKQRKKSKPRDLQ